MMNRQTPRLSVQGQSARWRRLDGRRDCAGLVRMRLYCDLFPAGALTMGLPIACSTCGLVQRVSELQPGDVAECVRCGSAVCRRAAATPAIPAALALGALILYVPANVYPILRMNWHGVYSESTVWDGVVSLFDNNQRLVALIVLLASIVIPLLKLLSLFFLVATSSLRSTRLQLERTRLYRLIEVIGPWAMLDVFLLAVLVALVKLEQIATILPGTGLLAFAAMVVLTMLASASFDPESIWYRRTEAP
jgi:paraquat-inducible protein A